jgi:two-component system alkaline phosphatase synthesis response regulator PhoP
MADLDLSTPVATDAVQADSTKKQKILVVEDERPLAKALFLKLQHAGFEVKNAYDGLEALEMLQDEPFDLMTLDLIIPKLDGFKLLEEIVEQKINVPVIVTSNLSQEEDFERAKSLGVNLFFVKSNTSISNIVENIKQVLTPKTV